MKRLLFLLFSVLICSLSFGQRYYYGRNTFGSSSSYTQLLDEDIPSNFLKSGDAINWSWLTGTPPSNAFWNLSGNTTLGGSVNILAGGLLRDLTFGTTGNNRFQNFEVNNTGLVAFNGGNAFTAPYIATNSSGFSLGDTGGSTTPFIAVHFTDNIKFQAINSGVYRFGGNSTQAAQITLEEDTDNGSNFLTITPPASIASDWTLTLPSDDGDSGEVLVTDGSGNTSWGTAGPLDPGADVGDIPYLSSTGPNAYSALADVATGNALISGGVGTAPSYGKIGLTTHVSGDLPFSNLTQIAGLSVLGVTGSSTADVAAITGTANQVLRVNSGGTSLAFVAPDWIATTGTQTGLTGDKTTAGTWKFNPAATSTTAALFGASATTSLANETIQIRADQNAATFVPIINNSNGSAATASLTLTNITNFSALASFETLAASFTTSGIREADKAVIRSNKVNGMNVGTFNATPLGLWTNNTLKFSIASGGTVTASSLAGTGNRLVQANSSGDMSATLTVASSTYTPTLSNTTNVSGSTAYVTGYYRIGNMVTVAGKIDIDPTAAAGADTVLGVTLPIASNLAAEEDLGGTAASHVATTVAVRIYGDPTNDRATFRFPAGTDTNDSYSFQFSYQVK